MLSRLFKINRVVYKFDSYPHYLNKLEFFRLKKLVFKKFFIFTPHQKKIKKIKRLRKYTKKKTCERFSVMRKQKRRWWFILRRKPKKSRRSQNINF